MVRQRSTLFFLICVLVLSLLGAACAPLEVPGSISPTGEAGKASPLPSQASATATPAGAASGVGQSGIAGKVLIGPTCPVVKVDSPCPDQPYQATITVLDQNGRQVKQFQSDEEGNFQLTLDPGTYVLHPESPGGPTRAPEQTVTVTSGQFTQVTITYDSGIR